MKKKVIRRENLPGTLPLNFGITAWLFLDKVNASAYVRGAFWCFFTLVSVAIIVEAIRNDHIDIFKDK